MNVLVLRDPRESAAKCSLTPLRGAERIRFVEYHPERRVAAGGRILLHPHPESERLSWGDRGKDLLLVDCAWRRVESLIRTVDGVTYRRRLPPLLTTYPRRSRTFADPDEGLASVEALYAATVILGEARPELLEGYRWREEFLRLNADSLRVLRDHGAAPPASALGLW